MKIKKDHDEKNLNRKIEENLFKNNEKEKKKQEEILKKALKEKEIRDNHYFSMKENKKLDKDRELKEDIQNLQFFRKEALDDQNKKKMKKEFEKENMIKIIFENNKHIQYLNDNKEKLRLEKKLDYEEYRAILEKQEIERDLQAKNLKDKIKNTVEKVGDTTRLRIEESHQRLEEQKYLNNQFFQDKIFCNLEASKKNEIKNLNLVVREYNDSIIINKKLRREQQKEKDLNFHSRLTKSVENYNIEKNVNSKKTREINFKNQEELQKQIIGKSSLNGYSMNFIERKYNSELIDELKRLK